MMHAVLLIVRAERSDHDAWRAGDCEREVIMMHGVLVTVGGREE